MDSSNQSSTTIITIAEIFLLFLVGILGNEIAEVLDISPFTLFILTGIVLVFLSILSYVKSKNISVEQLRNVLFLGVKRIFPRTMISVIPMGALMGWIIGAGSSLSVEFLRCRRARRNNSSRLGKQLGDTSRQ